MSSCRARRRTPTTLLLAALACPDPVIVIENRTLYGTKGDVVLGRPAAGPGWFHVRREGSDITLVTWGAITAGVLEAAEVVAADGISVEVLETPWLNPFPIDAVLESVSHTRRLVAGA